VKVKEINEAIERQIVTYSITSTKYVREVHRVLEPSLMKSTYARTVIGWCLEYYKEYKEAPGKHIQDIYRKNMSLIRDEDDTELISEFLLRLSKEYEAGDVRGDRDNIPFLAADAVLYLRMRALEKLKDALENSALERDPVKGEQAVSNFKRVETPRDRGISLLEDTTEVTSAFLEEEDRLFRFPGCLGKEIGDLSRSDVIAFMAAAKRGKSWWEWYTSQLALYYGYRVVLFNLEMSDNQYIRRGWTSLVGMPRRRHETQKVRKVDFPVFYKASEESELWEVRVESREYKTVDLSTIKLRQKNFRRQFRSGGIRICTFPAYSATIDTIRASLDNLLYYDEFVPDVIVVDYADLIAPSGNYRGEYRHQLDEIWKSLRRIAQERNALLVTATQSGRDSFNQDAKEKDVAEDIRKIAHVAKLIAINQSRKEREYGMCRVQQLVERDDRHLSRQVTVLQCLDIGQVCLDSRLTKEVETIEDDEEQSSTRKRRKR